MYIGKIPVSIYGIALSMLLAVLLLAPSSVKAQRSAGVQAGDWADYMVTFEGNSTEFMAEDFFNVTGTRLNIIDVSGTNVTFEGYTYFENGSDAVETGWIDVDTGNSGGNFTGEGILIAADLHQGDRIYTDSTTLFAEGTINETVNREYLGSMVEVNHFVINMTIPPNPFMNMTFRMSWFWYRETGLPAEMNFHYMLEGSGFMPNSFSTLQSSSNMTWFEINMLIVDFIPEFPTFTILPLFIFITIAVIALAKIQSKYKKLALPIS